MSAVQKISGILALGSARRDRADSIYNYIRIGADYFERVKIPGRLDSFAAPGKYGLGGYDQDAVAVLLQHADSRGVCGGNRWRSHKAIDLILRGDGQAENG